MKLAKRCSRVARVTLAMIAIPAAAGMLVACGDADSDGSGSGSGSGHEAVTYGFSPHNSKEAVLVDVIDRLKATGEEGNAKTLVADPNNEPVRQLQQVQTWLNGNLVDGVFVMPIDVSALEPALKLAASKEIPVVIAGEPPKEERRTQLTLTVNWLEYGTKAGTALADCINERFDGKAKVAILGGPNLPGTVIIDRIKGERQALAKQAPDAEIVSEQNGQGQRLPSMQTMTAILRANPDVTAVTGTNDDSMLGVVKAFEQAGKDPKEMCIVGLDATEEGLAKVKSGELYATVDLDMINGFVQGQAILLEMLRNEDSDYFGRNVLDFDVDMIIRKADSADG
jgi:ribose transport system substrate-binding protein